MLLDRVAGEFKVRVADDAGSLLSLAQQQAFCLLSSLLRLHLVGSNTRPGRHEADFLRQNLPANYQTNVPQQQFQEK